MANKNETETPKSAASNPDTAVLKPLNFRVPASFHRAFKIYAAEAGISMVELLEKSFAAYVGRKN